MLRPLQLQAYPNYEFEPIVATSLRRENGCSVISGSARGIQERRP
jgi:hypothetical protein